MGTLALLGRGDKWYVGTGDGLVWAPPFPVWHDTPGFWDDAHLAQHAVGPLFTVSFVGADGASAVPRARRMAWTPAVLELEYRLDPALVLVERRSAPGGRVLASEWTVRNTGRRALALHAVVWTALDGERVDAGSVSADAAGARLEYVAIDRKGERRPMSLEYAIAGGHDGWAAYRSEASGRIPDFHLTPFYDRWPAAGGLRNEARLAGLDARGLVYLGLARRLRLRPGATARLVAIVRVTPLGIPAPDGATRPAVVGAPSRQAVRSWDAYAGRLPTFRCSNPFFNRYWWYRWYGLRLNAVPGGLGQFRHPSVCEGIGYFHQPISYSAMCHAREVRWAHDPAWARGVIDTFFDHQREDGSLPGRVYLDHLRETDFYHADWGRAVADVLAVHPDDRWLRRLYPKLARYAEWLATTRDREGSGMIDVVDQYETGQEYMSRYQAVDPDADRYGWENRIRLKGVDVTVYAYRLYRFLETHAPDPAALERWRTRAERTRDAIRGRMWNPDQGMFNDVNPATGERTGVKAAVCFYPFLTDLVTEEHVGELGRHLFDAGQFWTPYPVPSSSADDPLFNPDAEWKGKRHVCPWNGRVWPMTNSHLVDALARVVRHHRSEWALHLVELLESFVRMMTFDQDPARPNCFEHYHPITGRPSRYRGIDDYQHSWVNDLMIRHVAGLLPAGERGVIVDPLPFGYELVELKGAVVAGRRIDVRVSGGRFRVRVDGREAGRGRLGEPLEVVW
ncbi:MAG TPA: hypothetical protein VNK43_07615 [Gemmatimonadales bacterium]|nr:hypothetical protein [Gemmatimonadales bacterium]